MIGGARGGVFAVGAAVSLLIGCAQPVFHPNDARFAAREANCQIVLRGSVPPAGFVEIGTITIEGDRGGGAGLFQNAEEFINAVRGDLCAAGVDMVVTEVGGLGYISRGIAFKRVAATAAAPPSASDPSAQPGACVPICSPGFDCVKGNCIPLCNPACEAGEICGRDRLCHAVIPPAKPGAPAP
jgi:hypothetical protein